MLPIHPLVRSDMSETLGEAVSDLTTSIAFWLVEKALGDLVRSF